MIFIFASLIFFTFPLYGMLARRAPSRPAPRASRCPNLRTRSYARMSAQTYAHIETQLKKPVHHVSLTHYIEHVEKERSDIENLIAVSRAVSAEQKSKFENSERYTSARRIAHDKWNSSYKNTQFLLDLLKRGI